MSNINIAGGRGKVSMTVEIKRANGTVETVQLEGVVIDNPEHLNAQPAQETSNEPDPQHGGA